MIIFDCDGVLVDTESISNRLLAEAITEAGRPMTMEESVRRYKGGRIKSLPRQIESEFGIELGPDFLDRFFEKQFAALARETKAIPGVRAVIDRLVAHGRGFCVASQASVAKMKISLGRCELWPLFEGRVFSSDMVANPKPAPDLFLHAARTMGWSPEDCTVIEDSATGVRGAVAAGMRVIGFSRDTDEAELRAAGAHVIVPEMAQVAGLLFDRRK
ncbi:MAG: HAD family phosphatase [Alphaproteobacteria bacterium]|nr:HAD family phosphatase [Alphaproteobacteria bacterium]